MQREEHLGKARLAGDFMTGGLKDTQEFVNLWDTWVAQLVKSLTPGFGSGHDLRVMGSSPVLGSMFSVESA